MTRCLLLIALTLLAGCSDSDKERPWTETEESLGSVGIRVMSALNTWVYQLTGGSVGGEFTNGAPILLLTTTGRKSGERRTSPLLYLRDGDDYIIVASKGGMSHHPSWYLNLVADPSCEVQVGDGTYRVTAVTVDDEERDRLWPRLVEMYPDYAVYQKRTERKIPVIRLTKVEGSRSNGT